MKTRPAAAKALKERCGSCHAGERRLPKHPGDVVGINGYAIDKSKISRRMSNHVVFNLTRPKQSLMLLAALAKSAGGYGIC